MEAQLSSSDAARLSPAFVMKFGRADETVLPLPVQAAEDDESLLLRTQAGDREALGILFQRYSRLIMSVGYRVLQDKSEAEDLLHDVFLFLINKSELFDPSRGTARSWLAKLTYHRALNLRKRLARCSYCDTTGDGDSVFDLQVEANSHTVNALELLYWHKSFAKAFEDLPAEQRTTLELHFFEGLTFDEIGGQLGKSRNNIRHYYYRGLDRLREIMNSSR